MTEAERVKAKARMLLDMRYGPTQRTGCVWLFLRVLVHLFPCAYVCSCLGAPTHDYAALCLSRALMCGVADTGRRQAAGEAGGARECGWGRQWRRLLRRTRSSWTYTLTGAAAHDGGPVCRARPNSRTGTFPHPVHQRVCAHVYVWICTHSCVYVCVYVLLCLTGLGLSSWRPWRVWMPTPHVVPCHFRPAHARYVAHIV
jgi:hypothetical protein